ncbi:hypothetical protein LZ554_001803 [Drepanopeziza brunnea f. sp. 'monogermtubi']|nr:hypothetical protein LZ554_001803 [Drepanopeziza brunnea f. sp. 'monogermtubi']
MMFINAIVAAAGLSVSAVTAAPADLSARQDSQVSLCEHPDQNECLELSWTANTCNPLSSRLDDKITSFDTRGAECKFYMDHGCQGDFFTYDGIVTDILKLAGDAYFNDNISSWSCEIPKRS